MQRTSMIDEIEAQGYAVASVLSEPELALLRRAFERLEPARIAGFHSTLLHADPARRRAVDTVLRAILAPRLAELLPGLGLVVCSFAAKGPGDGGGSLPLHQDWTFVDEARYPSLGLWCPLVDVDEANGCLAVVPGSHRLARDPRAALAPPLRPELVRDGHPRLRSVPMRAGQVMVFDQRLLHASGPNGSHEARVAAAAVAVPTGAPLRHYCFRGRALDGSDAILAEVFEVDQEFFVTHAWGQRPRGQRSLGLVSIAPGRLEQLGPALPDDPA